MAEKNEKNNSPKASNDISEMLRLLRESVDADRRNENEIVSETESSEDAEIRASLEKIFEETALDTPPRVEEEVDQFEVNENDSWFDLEEEEDEPEEEDPDNDDPWYSDEEESIEDEIAEEEPVEEEFVEEEIEEEDPDNEDPWYSDEEESVEEEIAEEEPVEEEFVEEEIEEEDPDNDDPWYSDEEESIEDEIAEEEPVEEEFVEEETEEENGELFDLEEQILDAEADDEGWYAIDTDADEEGPEIEAEAGEIPLEEESVWYSEEENVIEDEIADEEIYQDEDFEDEDDYIDELDDYTIDPEDDTPEDDYAEEDVYIYDAEIEEQNEELIYEEELDEAEYAEEEDEIGSIDETDLGLISALGIADAEDEPDDEIDTEEYAGDISYDYDGGEYVLENQRYEISAGYKIEKKKTLIRLALGGIIALILLIYESLAAFGVTMPGMLDYSEFPVSHLMISLQGLFICILLSAKQLYIGAFDLVTRRATPYSVSAAMVILNVIYTVVLAVALPDTVQTFNSIGAFSIVAAIAYEYLLLITEEHTFGIFSGKKGQKYAFVTEEGIDNDSEDKRSLFACSTEFNKNYFLRMRKRSEDYKYLTYLILSALGTFLLVFLVSLICKLGVGDSMRNGIMVLNLSLPIGIFGAFSYPIFRASIKALGNRGAFVGGGAIDEYSKTRFVTFAEEELFTSLKTAHVDLRPSGNENISEVLCKTSVLLSAIGGPMKKMVEVMQSEVLDKNVVIDEIFDDGISARADGVRMLAGSAQFLKTHGVEVDGSVTFHDNDESNEVLYVSIDGKLAARYYLKYKADTEFIKLVNELGARGISVGIRTKNPAVNSDVIARRCQGLKYKVYTIKAPAKNEDDIEMRRTTTDSGIVSLGKSLSLAYPLLACCDLKRYYKVDMFIRIISAALGALAVIVNAISGGATEAAVLWALIYHAIWFLPTVLFGMFHFNHRSRKKKFKIIHR